MSDKVYVRPYTRKMKAKITKAIKLNFEDIRNEQMARNLVLYYDSYQEKDGILFGKTNLTENGTSSKYFIAIDEDTKEVLSYAKRVDTWYSHDFRAYDKDNNLILDVNNVKEWKQYVISKYGKKKR